MFELTMSSEITQMYSDGLQMYEFFPSVVVELSRGGSATILTGLPRLTFQKKVQQRNIFEFNNFHRWTLC